MIAKRVERKSGARYSALFNYLSRKDKVSALDQKDPSEWGRATNCNFDEMALAVKEIETTQALNTRSTIDRTYHLVVSFPKGEVPTQEQTKDIENELCKAVGLGEHQRISVIHRDTDNFHFHVAINKIHPETRRAIEPYYDKYKLDTACAELELKHGLQRDNRIDREAHQEKLTRGQQSGRAGDLEVHQGQASFKQWVAARKNSITSELNRAETWADAHRALAKRGVSIRPRGSGLVITNPAGDVFVKASDLGRDFGKAGLEKRLGEYRAPNDRLHSPNARRGYSKPSQKAKEVAKPNALWESYQQETNPLREKRAQLLADLKKRRDDEIKKQKLVYEKTKLSVIFDRTLSREQRSEIIRNLGIRRVTISREAYKKTREERKEILTETKLKGWGQYVTEQAKSGNREAIGHSRRLERSRDRKQREHEQGR